MKKWEKSKFEASPAITIGCTLAMVAWMFLMGIVMLGLKMSAGSQ